MSDHIAFGEQLARKAGSNMLTHFRIGVETDWKDSDSTPLTLVDRQNNDLILTEVSKVFPDYSIISEEGSIMKDSEYAVIADPLDGTFGFSHGFPTFVFALAFAHRGLPFASVIFDPTLNRMFTAEHGKGAFLNGSRISVKEWPLKNTKEMITVGLTWIQSQRDCGEVMKKIIAMPGLVFGIASASYSGAMVACGQLVAGIYPVKSPWDGAAVKILVEEAGGKVTDIFGEEQRGDTKNDGFIAAPPRFHDTLVQ